MRPYRVIFEDCSLWFVFAESKENAIAVAASVWGTKPATAVCLKRSA
jgi:hypothetical protein